MRTQTVSVARSMPVEGELKGNPNKMTYRSPGPFGLVEYLVYGLASVCSTLLFPFLFFQALVQPKLRAHLSERFGGGIWQQIEIKDKPRIWFHAASVGEVAGISSLVERCRQDIPQVHVICSTTSVTGRAEVLRRKLSVEAGVVPYDHPLCVERVFRRLRPKLLILAETELWPVLILTARAKDVRLILMNARISNRSFGQYLRFRFFVRPLLESFAIILAQTEQDRARFLALGAPADVVHVCGSTKYSESGADSAEEGEHLAARFGIDLSKPRFVAGSVRADEDVMVIRAYCEVRTVIPHLQMVIAPRHPERFGVVADLLRSHGVQFRRRSMPSDTEAPVLLLDSLGELTAAYALADVSFVGGTLIPVGGHNPFEPAKFGSPVLLGPHFSNAQDAVEQLLEVSGAAIVRDHHELAQRLEMILQDSQLRQSMGEAARDVWRRNAGALEKVMPVLLQLAE